MRELAGDLARLGAERTPYALARVVETWSSAPRLPGAAMIVTATGEVIASVSGGCVEGAVVELAAQVLADGVPRLETYGVSDSDAFAVGLTCGGVISVLVEPVTAGHPLADPALLADLAGDRPVVLRTTLADGAVATTASTGPAALAAGPTRTGRSPHSAEGRPHSAEGRPQSAGVFVHAMPGRPLMILAGANDFVRTLAAQGRLLGYRVEVVDARAAFATPERFPDADSVVVDWPHRHLARARAEGRIDGRTAICVLSHDPKFDIPAIAEALGSPAGYVGAMGSRRTDAERRERLREAGVTDDRLDRLSSPIGLDLAAASPAETAVAIAAEIVMLARGGTPHRLVDTTEAIHR
ncbi:MAG: XdhC family protein [Nocardioides sp.]|uniref:XdhC family protein n=1 Tax=Nocardioides sp. TaxID=35761 RepID=UPI0039E504C6